MRASVVGRGGVTLRLVLAWAVVLGPGGAYACSFAAPDYVEIAPRDPMDGERAPPAPSIRVEGIRRGSGDEPQTSCSDIGMLSLSLPDDELSASGIYLFERESGDATIEVPSRPIRAGAPQNGRRYFLFTWIDGADADQEPLHERIRITALSADGARGGTSVVDVDDPGT